MSINVIKAHVSRLRFFVAFDPVKVYDLDINLRIRDACELEDDILRKNIFSFCQYVCCLVTQRSQFMTDA